MQQIILITDGCSNVGVNPVIAAAHAKAEGIVVNVIGVIDQGELGELGSAEIREIAEASGGMSRIVSSEQLSQTVQMMTRKTVMNTIQQAVGQELKHILGRSRIEELPPSERSQVVQAMDELGETSSLRVALLVDTSASMKPKLASVKEAIYDLQLSLQSRAGESELAVFHFPGSLNGGEELEMDFGWTKDLANLSKLFYKINMKGTTPTGPALLKVVQFMTGHSADSRSIGRDDRFDTAYKAKDGMLSDYVV